MNENKRLLVLCGVVILIIAIILLIVFWPAPDKTFACKVKAEGDYTNLAAITYEDYQCLQDENNIVLAMGDISDKEKANLNAVGKDNGIGIYYLSDEVSNSDKNKIESDLEYSDKSFEKDVLLVLNKGEVSEYKEDILGSEEDIYNFLDEAGVTSFACGVATHEEYENLGEITYEDYECLLDSDKPFALVIAQTTCSYCEQFAPIINDYAGENNIPVYIVYLDKLESDDYSNLLGSLDYFDNNDSWGTPLTLGIDNKEVVANLSGYTDDTEAIDSFMEQAGLK